MKIFWIRNKYQKMYHLYIDNDDMSLCHLKQKPWKIDEFILKQDTTILGKKCKYCEKIQAIKYIKPLKI